MAETTHLNLPLIEAGQAQKHVTHNEAIAALDAIVMLSVVDRDHSSPPASPAEGDRYLVKATGAGDFAGKDDQIAHYINGAFEFYSPRAGWLAFVEDENALAVFDGDDWIALHSDALQELTLLGLGTSADATNPFSAKLNKALWTARYASEGGDGDLRYTLNKEATAKVLSFLFQSNWSGRAEVGLVGDDDLHVKVSADGSTWTEALKVNKTTGNLRLQSLTIGQDAPETGSVVSFVSNGAAGTLLVDTVNDANTGYRASTYINNDNGPTNIFRKARGTKSSPAVVAQNDVIGRLGFHFYDGTTFTNPLLIEGKIIEPTPSPTAGGMRFVINMAPLGSVTRQETLRLDHNTGLSMYGANVVIDHNRHHVLRSYTVSTLPSASVAGQLIYVSNGTSNKRVAVSDGTNWRWPDGAVVS